MTHSQTPAPDPMEDILRRFFEQNFEYLRLESGHVLTPEAKESAWQQVRLYWRKLHDVAMTITDTEVTLHLPGQTTPKNRPFGIEGVVDIVRAEGRTTMYDIKTHDLETIRGNLDLYAQQLNIYAHIWQHLRGQMLDETAVISTSFPRAVTDALHSTVPGVLDDALDRWEPIVDIPVHSERLDETIQHFGAIVDAIEDGAFDPPPIETLQRRLPGTRATFAAQVCVNCDARYSCDAFRTYLRRSSRRIADAPFTYMADTAADTEVTDRIVARLDEMPATLE